MEENNEKTPEQIKKEETTAFWVKFAICPSNSCRFHCVALRPVPHNQLGPVRRLGSTCDDHHCGILNRVS